MNNIINRSLNCVFAIIIVFGISADANAQIFDLLKKLQKNTEKFLEDIDPKDDATHVERALQTALFAGRSGPVIQWENPHNGHRGEITLTSKYSTANDEQCWKYTRTEMSGGNQTTFTGNVCDEIESVENSAGNNWTIGRETLVSKTTIAEAIKPSQEARVEPPPKIVKAKKRPVPDATVQATQNYLKQLGFNPGPADGLMGRKTREAIIEYQRSRNLVVDGRASPELATHLKSATSVASESLTASRRREQLEADQKRIERQNLELAQQAAEIEKQQAIVQVGEAKRQEDAEKQRLETERLQKLAQEEELKKEADRLRAEKQKEKQEKAAALRQQHLLEVQRKALATAERERLQAQGRLEQLAAERKRIEQQNFELAQQAAELEKQKALEQAREASRQEEVEKQRLETERLQKLTQEAELKEKAEGTLSAQKKEERQKADALRQQQLQEKQRKVQAAAERERMEAQRRLEQLAAERKRIEQQNIELAQRTIQLEKQKAIEQAREAMRQEAVEKQRLETERLQKLALEAEMKKEAERLRVEKQKEEQQRAETLRRQQLQEEQLKARAAAERERMEAQRQLELLTAERKRIEQQNIELARRTAELEKQKAEEARRQEQENQQKAEALLQQQSREKQRKIRASAERIQLGAQRQLAQLEAERKRVEQQNLALIRQTADLKRQQVEISEQRMREQRRVSSIQASARARQLAVNSAQGSNNNGAKPTWVWLIIGLGLAAAAAGFAWHKRSRDGQSSVDMTDEAIAAQPARQQPLTVSTRQEATETQPLQTGLVAPESEKEVDELELEVAKLELEEDISAGDVDGSAPRSDDEFGIRFDRSEPGGTQSTIGANTRDLPPDVIEIAERAQESFDRGRLEDAAYEYRKALELAPDSASLLFSYGMMLNRMEEFAKAREVLSRAVELDPNDADYRANLGLVLVREGRWEEGMPYLERCLIEDPDMDGLKPALVELYTKGDVNGWTHVPEGYDIPAGYYPTEKSHVDNAKIKLEQARELSVGNPESENDVREFEQILENALKRTSILEGGDWFLPGLYIVVGVLGIAMGNPNILAAIYFTGGGAFYIYAMRIPDYRITQFALLGDTRSKGAKMASQATEAIGNTVAGGWVLTFIGLLFLPLVAALRYYQNYIKN